MYKCKICGKKYTDLSSLYNHIEHKHSDMIPKDMTVQQYYYYMKTGRTHGNCVMCKQPTTWNKNTNKYNRFCGNPKCKDEYVRIMKSRMIAKYGKVHLLNDPEKQREMLAKRKISGTYKWSDSKFETTYTGSYELDFLKTLDMFFEWDPQDVSMPSPHTYTYKYEGEDKFYIPDAFIHSLDLEIEIKDGGDNPNNHYKIQAVDKEKERLKDEVLMSQRNFHYVKITNKNYTNFFEFLKEVKEAFEKYGDDKKIPRIFKTEDIKSGNIVKPVTESLEDIEESTFINKIVDKTSKIKNAPLRSNEVFFSLQYDLRKDDPIKLKEYINTLVKAAKYEDDIRFVRELVCKSDTYYHNLLKKRPELKNEYDEYYNWVTSNDGLPKEIKSKMKKIKEGVEIEHEEIIYETSISFYYINKCLQNGYEEELKKYLDTYKQYYQKMLDEKPHSIPNINEDIKKAIIFIDGLANKGVENNLIQFAKSELGDIVNIPKNSKPCRIFETNEIEINNDLTLNEINIKLVFDQNKTRNLFGMNDLQSQIQLENYIIQRDRMGNHCSISPGLVNKENKKIIECQLSFSEALNINNSLKEKMQEGTTINSLFNPNDKDYKFIKEACLRIFGVYPDSIKIK